MAIQDLRRSLTFPTYPAASQDHDPVQYLERIAGQAGQNYSRLATQVNAVHNAMQVYQKIVAGAAATYALTLTTPYPDTNYSAFVLPSWNTAIWYSGQTIAGVIFNFAIAAPGGGGRLLIWTVR